MTAPRLPLGLLFDSVGGVELLLFLAIVLMLFGPRRLPEIARQVGRWTHILRQTAQEFKDQVMRATQEEASRTPPAILPTALLPPSPLPPDTAAPAAAPDIARDKEGDAPPG